MYSYTFMYIVYIYIYIYIYTIPFGATYQPSLVIARTRELNLSCLTTTYMINLDLLHVTNYQT